MVRTVITPQQQNISITVPENYIGKQIEVLLYAVDELNTEEKRLRQIMLLNTKASFPKKKVKNLINI